MINNKRRPVLIFFTQYYCRVFSFLYRRTAADFYRRVFRPPVQTTVGRMVDDCPVNSVIERIFIYQSESYSVEH